MRDSEATVMAEPTKTQPVIAALNVRKSFGGIPALRGCTLCVREGDIHALLGQNGAGKSTLVKILNGVHPAGSFEGEILIRGVRSSYKLPAQARRAGIGYVPQEIEVIEGLSVAENIFAGQTGLNSKCLVSWKNLRERTQALLGDLGLPFNPSTPLVALSTAQRHLVMIARALAAHPAVLILDEPTSSLSEPEIEHLFVVLRTLKARGVTMIYITHRLPEVLALCDRASILRDGVVAAEFDREEFSVEALISAMSGGRLESFHLVPRNVAVGASLLKVKNLSVKRVGCRSVRNVSFELQAGEILGIAGVVGAGRTELLSAIYGHLPYEGRLFIENQECSIASTRQARRAGIALLTEDRKRDGLLFNLSVRSNITIGYLRLFSWAGVVRSSKERADVVRQLAALNVKAPSLEAKVVHLSGGNQQKLLFGRVLLRTPKILLLDEPTKGVDISTRLEIYRLIVDLADRGVGVLIVCSDLEEVIGLADRCLVMAEGRIIDEFTRGQGTESRVLHTIAQVQSLKSNVRVSGSYS
jgi:ribose transport system ATP-binding protein